MLELFIVRKQHMKLRKSLQNHGIVLCHIRHVAVDIITFAAA